MIGVRSVPRTGSSTWLVSDPTAVFRLTLRIVPAGIVTSRHSWFCATGPAARFADSAEGKVVMATTNPTAVQILFIGFLLKSLLSNGRTQAVPDLIKVNFTVLAHKHVKMTHGGNGSAVLAR